MKYMARGMFNVSKLRETTLDSSLDCIIVPAIGGSSSNNSIYHWIQELKDAGYHLTNIIAPNMAVQLILGCIRRPEIHKQFIWKETNLPEARFNELGNDIRGCLALIDQTYRNLPDAIYDATMTDAANVQTFIRGLTALEKANGIKISNPPLTRPATKTVPRPTIPISLDTCLFDLSTLTNSERIAILGIGSNNEDADFGNMDEADNYKIKQLNLANCCCFPIISPRLVESFGQRHDHALWRSKNLGVIAPLSADTLIKLAGITPEEVAQAELDELDADNLIRKVDRMDVVLPVGIAFFGKDCAKRDGFIMGQKDHMAKADERRNDFYVKKIWRTFCPYIKCNCQKYTRRKSDCMDGGIKWFDGRWY